MGPLLDSIAGSRPIPATGSYILRKARSLQRRLARTRKRLNTLGCLRKFDIQAARAETTSRPLETDPPAPQRERERERERETHFESDASRTAECRYARTAAALAT